MNSLVGDHEPKPVSRRVVEKVADATNRTPMDIEPLYRSVDPDCLDGLFDDSSLRTARSDGHVSFTLAGCEVVVWADETIDVYRDERESAISPLGLPEKPPSKTAESPD